MTIKQFFKFLIAGAIGAIIGLALFFIDIKSMIDNIEINTIISQGIVTVLMLVVLAIYMMLSNKIKKDNYSNDENSVYEKYSTLFQINCSCSTILVIINMIALGVNLSFMDTTPIFLILFIVNGALGFALETSHVNLLKKIQPEKNADITKLDYNQKAVETLDEYEIQIAGKAAVKTMGYMLYVYLFVFVVGVLTCSSPLFFICTGGIWIANQTIFMLMSHKIEKYNLI